MKFRANFQYKPSNFQMDDCQIEKVVELSHEAFCRLKITPLEDQPFIAENKGCMFRKEGVMHCLLALGEGLNDGILIEADGCSFPRYAAYVPGMRDILSAEMDRVADFIVEQAVENTSSGSWCFYFDELEKHLGLMIREGSGLDTKLLEAMERRPEVADVALVGDCIDAVYYLDYCRNLEEQTWPGME